MRFNLNSILNFKMEFGFVTSQFDLADPTHSDGAVLVKATPSATLPNFQVVVYDTDDNTNLGVVSRTRNAATSASEQSSAESLLADGDNVLAVWANEMGGTAFWLNGRFYGSTQSQPMDTSSVAAPRLRSYDSSYKQESGSHLWVYVQNRTGAQDSNVFTIDYIKAWQERRARDF
jgi:hypothetical protein